MEKVILDLCYDSCMYFPTSSGRGLVYITHRGEDLHVLSVSCAHLMCLLVFVCFGVLGGRDGTSLVLIVIVGRRVRLAGGAVAAVVLLAGVLSIAFTAVVVIAVVDGDAGDVPAGPDVGAFAAHLGCGLCLCG
jgi:hypothetical protein